MTGHSTLSAGLRDRGRAPVKLGALCPRSGRGSGPLNWAALPTQSQGGSMARQRGGGVLRGLVGSVVGLSLLVGACNDSQKPPESPKPAPQVTAVAPPAPP